MPAYAFSDIKELQDDGKIKVFHAGDKLEGLSQERIAHLLEIGAASNYDRTKSTGEQVQDALVETDELRAKVAELEAQLAAASKEQPKTDDSKSSGPTTGTAKSSGSATTSK